jgi:REP element-mobilizing transposase RayT
VTRFWLLTSTTYGTWLPGDRRGFVSTVRDETGPRIRHNQFDTPYDEDFPELHHAARAQLKGQPLYLGKEHADEVVRQFHETASCRGWNLLATAVMPNHFHIVVEVGEEVHSTELMRDFKSYASRALSRRWPKPACGTWWTESGSRRPLYSEDSVEAAIEYVRQQPGALALWIAESPGAPPSSSLSF